MSWLFDPQDLDKLLFLPTIVLGLGLACVYGIKCWKGSLEYRLEVLIALLLQSGGLVSGLVLMFITVSSALNGSYTPLRLQTFIGGLLMSAFSVKGLYGSLKNQELEKDRLTPRSSGRKPQKARFRRSPS
jgi:hypothetical protein